VFSILWSAVLKPASRRPQRSRSTRFRLSVESLEDRTVPSGGSDSSVTQPSGSTSGGPGSPPAAVVTQTSSPGTSGGQGTSGGTGSVNISGPGYPLPPSCGPTRPDAGTLDPSQPTTVLVPLTGTPGGPGPTLAVVPMVTA
jgi:hypothetical protein